MKLYPLQIDIVLKDGNAKKSFQVAYANSEDEAIDKVTGGLYKRMKRAQQGDKMLLNCREKYADWESFFVSRTYPAPSRIGSYHI